MTYNRPPFPTLIDASLMAAYKSCPEMCKKTYFEHWKSKGQSVHLHAGGAFAKGLEAAREAFYVQGHPRPAAEAIGLTALLTAYGDFEAPAESAKTAERMAGAYEFYMSNYPMEHDNGAPITLPSGKKGIEFSFVEPLEIAHPESGDPLLYCGRLDTIINYAGGVYMEDDKTTSQLGGSWGRQWDLRSQFTGYGWGAERNGIHVDGVIVRGISILKTKYDCAQAISYRPEWQIERWHRELHWWLKDMIRSWETGEWKHNLDHACAEYGGCQYRLACCTKPEEEAPWLETGFEKRIWNPLLRTETKIEGAV